MDLGNYERLDATLCRENNITTGKIYVEVIGKLREGKYLGKTVQGERKLFRQKSIFLSQFDHFLFLVVPHITDAIQEWIERVAQQPINGNVKPEVCVIELGGTIGDIEGMPFVEAFRQFQFRVKVRVRISVNVSFNN